VDPSPRRDVSIRKRSLHDEDDPTEMHASLSPAERIELSWQLTLDAWEIQGIKEVPRLARHAVRVLRRGES
jgi:hypothetical protein